RRSRVFDIVPHREGHETNIASLKIEGPRLTRRGENTHPRLSVDVILPLVGVRMPMHLTHAARLNFDQCRSDRFRCGKYARVGDAYRAALGLDWLLRKHPVAEYLRHRRSSGYLVGNNRTGHLGVE